MKISLIGRPNVGKSSVFNRLIGRRVAIVDDVLGVTRDRKYGVACIGNINFDVIDTPGVSANAKDQISSSMNEQSFAAINESDLVFFVIDAKEGITQEDKDVASWLRKTYKKIGNKETVILANKSESVPQINELKKLGFGDGIYISAEHNIGLSEIADFLLSKEILEGGKAGIEKSLDIEKIAIVGRPNVGKSTLLNALLGQERVITGDLAGTTRDSIGVDFEYKGRTIELFDTAGQRRKSKITSKLENVSVLDAWRYIKQVHSVIIVIDANMPFENQDLNIARQVVDEGKIVVFAVNKIDTISNPDILMKNLQNRLKKEFAQVPDIRCVPISAKSKKNVNTLLDVVHKLYTIWNHRIKTSDLNRFLEAAINAYYPPLVNGLPIKIKYISQTSTKPPTFTLFANRAEHLPDSYKRYLVNRLREMFKIYGVPVRLNIRCNSNPYDKRRNH